MTEKSVIRDRLWHSLEMQVLRRDLILYMIGAVIVILVGDRDLPRGVIAIISGFVFLPFVIFLLWRSLQIFRKPESYAFYKTTLSQPYQKWPLKSMYFRVVLEEPDGSKRIEDTHAIFACHGIVEPLVESYVNSTVTIGLNKETGMVVVIG